MLIWNGHGILIPIFTVIGFVGGIAAGAALRAAFNFPEGLAIACGAMGAAILVWIYAVTIGRTKEQTLIDPRNGQPVILRKKHTFFFIPAKGWVFLLVVLALITAFTPREESSSSDRGSVTDSSGKKAFNAASDLIMSARNGTAHGNTAEAKKLAEAYSQRLKDLRELGVEAGKKKSAASLSKGEFLTYCLLTKESCVFLVHVPELRKFSDEAKDFISAAAWRSAQEVVQNEGVTPVSLGVGVRGAVLYERAMSGKVAVLSEDPRAGIDEEVSGNDETKLLARLFDLAEKPAAVEPKPTVTATDEVATPPPAAPVPAVSESPVPAPATMPEPTPVPAPTAATLPTELKDWKSADGRVMNAQLVKFSDAEGKTAEFKRADGVVFQVPVDRFDAAVQEELKQLHQASAK